MLLSLLSFFLVPPPSPKPEHRLGSGISAHKRSAVDALWAEMNAEDASQPEESSGGTGRATGSDGAAVAATATGVKGKGNKATKKNKANKKANKVQCYDTTV